VTVAPAQFVGSRQFLADPAVEEALYDSATLRHLISLLVRDFVKRNYRPSAVTAVLLCKRSFAGEASAVIRASEKSMDDVLEGDFLGLAVHSAARSIMPGPEVNHEHRNYPLSHPP
jgi:hypothetical protein